MEKELEKEKELQSERKLELEKVLEKKLEKNEKTLSESPEGKKEEGKTDDDDKNNYPIECLNYTFPPLKQPGETKKRMTPVKNALNKNALKDKSQLDVVEMKSQLGLVFKNKSTIHARVPPPT